MTLDFYDFCAFGLPGQLSGFCTYDDLAQKMLREEVVMAASNRLITEKNRRILRVFELPIWFCLEFNEMDFFLSEDRRQETDWSKIFLRVTSHS
ncbi:MAG: hypothetical protein WCI92_04035 [Bacteroidota bacterium]